MFQCQRRLFFRASAATLVGMLLSLNSSCGGGGGGDTDGGSLSLSIFTEIASTSYRLSNSSFQLSGGEYTEAAPLTLDTGAVPTVLNLQQSLEPGQYSIELQPNWVLQRETATGFEAVPGATLTSANPLVVNVVQGQVARVGFAFDAGGVAVDFQQSAGENDNAD
jgi:hypothetical protein